MKRFALIAAWLVALVLTSVAVAHLRAGDVAAVSATISATTPTNVETRTFTCDGQTIEVTTGRWSGTATSSTSDLNGPAELRLKSVYNATKKLAWVDGRLRIRAADDRSLAHVTGVNSDGKLDAWVRGTAGYRDGFLFGSLSGSFSKSSGLTAGVLGTGSGANAALIAKHVRCDEQRPPRPSVHLLVRGQIEAVGATSISVKPRDGSATQTCAVRDDDDIDHVKAGDRVEMICVQVAGGWTLAKVRKL